MKSQELLCFLLMVITPLCRGDDRFAAAISQMFSHVAGQPITEKDMTKIAYIQAESSSERGKMEQIVFSLYQRPYIAIVGLLYRQINVDFFPLL